LRKSNKGEIIPKILLERISKRLIYLGSIPHIFGRRKKYIRIPRSMMKSSSTGMAS
jgi:hypothetical protein